jgi:hypothetical protein
MTVEQLRQQIRTLSPEQIQRLGREILAVERYRHGELDLSGFALDVGLSSLADAPSLLRQYGVEPKPEHLTTLDGLLAALRSGALDFVAEDEDLYTEADLLERYR